VARSTELKRDPDAPFRDEMKTLIAKRFSDLWTALPVAIEGVDPEGVHDVRVASRRLRAAMDVTSGTFPEAWFADMLKTVKAITSELGEVRDRDVMLEFLASERKRVRAQDRAGIDKLIERVEREREVAREHMLKFLASLESDEVMAESIRRFGSDAEPKKAEPAES
jgi:triphosphatase